MRGPSISKKQAVKIEVARPALESSPPVGAPSQSSIAKVAFELGGKLVGGGFLNSFAEMQRAQWLTPEELRDRSDARLRQLLQHAAEHVPFYSRKYKRHGLSPDDLQQAKNLTALPVMRKADYRNHEAEEFYATNIPAYRRLHKSTSGSTGEPFQFCLDRRALPVIFASHLFYDSWYGLRPFDRYIRIAASPPAPPSISSHTPPGTRLRQSITGTLQSLYEQWTQERISVWEIDAERALSIWKRIEAFRPQYVMGYASSLATIADELLQRGIRLSHPLRGVVTIAETLSPTRRRLLDEFFAAPIINRYGLRELGSWSAQSCSASPEQFHINTEIIVCEILRDDGTPCAPGERGRVVLTDLYNYARPFIRYDTGDLATAGNEQCSCGRGLPLMSEIEGRSQECLRTPSGKEISPAVLGHYLFVYHNHLAVVRHYQLVQESSDRVRLLIVPDKGWDEQKRDHLRADLAAWIGDEMKIEVEAVAEIPKEKSGKRPIIKLRRDV
jgi:phenylacetate-CoA ligase